MINHKFFFQLWEIIYFIMNNLTNTATFLLRKKLFLAYNYWKSNIWRNTEVSLYLKFINLDLIDWSIFLLMTSFKLLIPSICFNLWELWHFMKTDNKAMYIVRSNNSNSFEISNSRNANKHIKTGVYN
jgi:hypothetical protein